MDSAGETILTAKFTKKQNFLQALKYLMFTTSAGIIQAVSFTLMNETIHWDYWPSYLIALALSVVYNFTINRKFTFTRFTSVCTDTIFNFSIVHTVCITKYRNH